MFSWDLVTLPSSGSCSRWLTLPHSLVGRPFCQKMHNEKENGLKYLPNTVYKYNINFILMKKIVKFVVNMKLAFGSDAIAWKVIELPAIC
jgi:hypothetical protein